MVMSCRHRSWSAAPPRRAWSGRRDRAGGRLRVCAASLPTNAAGRAGLAARRSHVGDAPYRASPGVVDSARGDVVRIEDFAARGALVVEVAKQPFEIWERPTDERQVRSVVLVIRHGEHLRDL